MKCECISDLICRLSLQKKMTTQVFTPVTEKTLAECSEVLCRICVANLSFLRAVDTTSTGGIVETETQRRFHRAQGILLYDFDRAPR